MSLDSQPILKAGLTTDLERELVLYGNPGWIYGIEYQTNLSGSAPWSFLTQVQMTAQLQEISDTGPNAPSIFYRAYGVSAPPTLAAILSSNQIHLTLCGVPGTTYTIEYTTNQASGTPWLFLADIPLHDTCQDLGGLGTNATPTYYRVVQQPTVCG